MTAGTMGVTPQRQQLAFDQQVAGRADDHGMRIRHTIQPVEGIDKIYPKTPFLSCRTASHTQEKGQISQWSGGAATILMPRPDSSQRADLRPLTGSLLPSRRRDLRYCISIHILIFTIMRRTPRWPLKSSMLWYVGEWRR